MRTSICVAICLAALFPASAALADSDSNLGVAVVVNMTDQGRKVPKPTSDRPVYYYPVTRGYTEGGAILTGEPPPPPTAEVQHMIAKALAEEGYLVSARHSPSLVLIFWWGYKAPEFIASSDEHLPSAGPTLNLSAMVAAGVNNPGATIPGFNFLALPPNLAANHNEMEELVFGSEYEPDSFQNLPNLRLEALINASRVARYYLMVSALDFNAAEQGRPVVLWTARVSTSLWGHTLDQVLPALIAAGAPMLGQDSDGPQMTSAPIVPMGRVIVGTPVIKVSNSGAP